MRKFFSVFSWDTKIFCLNFLGYEFFFGILEYHSAPVLCIKTDWSLSIAVVGVKYYKFTTKLFYQNQAII